MAKQKKDITPDYATREDVERAVDSLSQVDEVRLEKFARYRIRGLGRRATGRDHEDLLGEAINSTWIGAEDPNQGRRWRKSDVAFVAHLLGAMRSISSHWKESFDDDEAQLDCDLRVETESDATAGPIDRAMSNTPDQERTLIAKEELGAVYRLFQDDDDAALVIDGIKEGWNGPEIIERLNLPRKQYEAAVKRIRYHIK